MCCRYYLDENTLDEVAESYPNLRHTEVAFTAHDVHPREIAPILFAKNVEERESNNRNITDRALKLSLENMRRGFPRQGREGILINARTETVFAKSCFSESAINRRCVIPARGFYEWDKGKNKTTFQHEKGSVLFLAGIFKQFQNEQCFVILTTEANTSVQPIHDRMPLILEKESVVDWISSRPKAKEMLYKIPMTLKCTQEFEQQSLF